MDIKITYLEDNYDCDDCSMSYAYGARVEFEDSAVIELIPSAYCYNSKEFTDREIFKAILEHLGHAVTETDDVV